MVEDLFAYWKGVPSFPVCKKCLRHVLHVRIVSLVRGAEFQ